MLSSPAVPAPLAALPVPTPSPGPTVTVSPSPLGLLPDPVVPATQVTSRLVQACGATPTRNCARVFTVTHSDFLASLADPIFAVVNIVLVVLLALVLRAVAGRLIGRVTRSMVSDRVNRGLSRLERSGALLDGGPEAQARRTQRAQTVGSVLHSITGTAIFALALVLILGELGLNLAPIIASAGIVGVAVGFGAQSVVRDFLSGIFLVLEDQYGVGDVIDLTGGVAGAGVIGVVESIGLRSTRVRDVRGTLWHVRNGEIRQVGNISQGWSRIVLDVLLQHGADVGAARAAMLDVAGSVQTGETWGQDVLEDPAVWGVEDVSLDGVALRLTVKVRASAKDDIARLLREELLRELPERGVRVARPAREVVLAPAAAPG